MKQCKTLLSIVMAIMMLLTMIVPTLADGEKFTIEISNAAKGETYTAYKIFDVTYSGTNYAYTIAKDNKFFETISGFTYEGKKVFTLTQSADDENVYIVEWDSTKVNETVAAALAEALSDAYDAMTTKPAGVTGTYDDETKVNTIDVTAQGAGYYFVKTTLGALCFLDTTNPKAEIVEKNTVTVDKKVQEDSDNSWGKENTAQIGQTVNFESTITAKKGAKNYVVHDKMTEGLTFTEGSIKVMVGETELTLGTDYTVSTETSDDCTFEITFTETYLDSIDKQIIITITYSAVLNEKAVIYDGANTNDFKLDYGDNSSTEWIQTKTYTYKFDLVKTDADNKKLDGAEFELYDAETGGNKIEVVEDEDGSYHIATPAEKAADGYEADAIVAGSVTIKGLDANTTYWLEEIKAPAGYNKLDKRVKVEIKEANLTATFEAEAADTWKEGGVHVVNQSGTELPSTGGIGTTIFYCAGAVLALGAFVLLVTKKRMGKE